MQKMKWTSRILLAAMLISGCSTSNNRPADPIPTPTPMTTPGNELTASVPTASADTETGELPDLQVRFGYDGESFILTLDEKKRPRQLPATSAKRIGIYRSIIMMIMKIMR